MKNSILSAAFAVALFFVPNQSHAISLVELELLLDLQGEVIEAFICANPLTEDEIYKHAYNAFETTWSHPVLGGQIGVALAAFNSTYDTLSAAQAACVESGKDQRK